MNFIFAICPNCDGSGVEAFRATVYEHGCAFPHDDSDERPCPTCCGEGVLETTVAEIR